MGSHAAPLPHEYPVDRQFGRATLGKMGMWFFLTSDALSFSGLLLAYGILRAGQPYWHCTVEGVSKELCHHPQPTLGIPFTAFLTFVLICSSVTMVMAVGAIMEKKFSAARWWMLGTIIGGALFLCGQMQEYFGVFEAVMRNFVDPEAAKGLIREGLVFGNNVLPDHNHYANTFYLITGFHGLHVLSGVIYNCFIFARLQMGKYADGNYNEIEMAGLFWHFVDLVWILVFTLVYLIPEG